MAFYSRAMSVDCPWAQEQALSSRPSLHRLLAAYLAHPTVTISHNSARLIIRMTDAVTAFPWGPRLTVNVACEALVVPASRDPGDCVTGVTMLAVIVVAGCSWCRCSPRASDARWGEAGPDRRGARSLQQSLAA